MRTFKVGDRFKIGGYRYIEEHGDTIRITEVGRSGFWYDNDRTSERSFFQAHSDFAEALDELPNEDLKMKTFKVGDRFTIAGSAISKHSEFGHVIRITKVSTFHDNKTINVRYVNTFTCKESSFVQGSLFAESLEALPDERKDLRFLFLLCALSAAFVIGSVSYLLDKL